MSSSRRDFLTTGLTAAIALAAHDALANEERRQGVPADSARRAGRTPVLGMIFPPANYPVPPEATQLYPSGIRFLARGIGLEAMTPDSYDRAIPRVLPAALDLAKEGATAISVMGTSLTFYKGRAFNENLTQQVAKATGLPATTMSTGIVDGLKATGAKRIALATAYNVEVTDRLKAFLEEHGFVVTAAKGLGYEKIPEGGIIYDGGLRQFCSDVYESSSRAEALLISCGGLKTIDLIVPLEARHDVPVVSSTPHALWSGVRLAGLDGRVDGYGRVLAGRAR